MSITGVESVISTASILTECLLLFTFVYRRYRRLFPIALYAAYHLAFSIAMRILHLRRLELDDLAYFADEALDFALLAVIIVALFQASRPGAQLHASDKQPPSSSGAFRYLHGGPARMMLLIAGQTVLSVAASSALVMSISFNGLTFTNAWKDRAELLTSFLLCTFLLISALTRARLGFQRTAVVSIIGRALAVWSCVALCDDLSHMRAGWINSSRFDQVSDGAWTCMMIIWVYALWREPSISNAEPAL